MNNTEWLNHPVIQTTLAVAGWYEGRRVDIGDWERTLSVEGYSLFPTAAAVLAEYGDLILNPPYLEDALFSTSEVRIDPVWAGVGESDRVLGWAEEVGKNLYPIGMVDPETWLMIAEDGTVYGDQFYYGANFEETLNLLILRNRRWTEVPTTPRKFLTPESLYRNPGDQR